MNLRKPPKPRDNSPEPTLLTRYYNLMDLIKMHQLAHQQILKQLQQLEKDICTEYSPIDLTNALKNVRGLIQTYQNKAEKDIYHLQKTLAQLDKLIADLNEAQRKISKQNALAFFAKPLADYHAAETLLSLSEPQNLDQQARPHQK